MPDLSSLLTSELGGAIAALLAAFLWAFSTLLFARLSNSLNAIEINLLKGLGALILSLMTLYALGSNLAGLPSNVVWLLALSGIIGITIGDTTYLLAVKHLGARRTLLLGTLAPPMTGLISWAFLGETLPWAAWIGILITVAGVGWVITERSAPDEKPVNLRLGLIFGMLANLSQSAALVLSRTVLTQSNISSLQSSIVRLIPGVALLIIWQLCLRRPPVRLAPFAQVPNLWRTVLTASVFGAFLALWLQQIAVSLAPAGIAQTLLSTSPIFILPMAAVSGEKISWRAGLGAAAALAGVWLLLTVTSV